MNQHLARTLLIGAASDLNGAGTTIMGVMFGLSTHDAI